MRILYVSPGLGAAGGIRVLFDHCTRLMARGHTVAIASPEVGRPTWYDLTVPVISHREASRQTWDVIVATGCETVRQALNISASSPVAKLFYFVQMAEYLFYRIGSPEYLVALESYALARDHAMRVIAIADWLKTELTKFGLSAEIVRNGVDETVFYRGEEKRGAYILVEGDQRNPAKDTEGIGWRVAMALQERYGLRTVAYAGIVHAYTDEMSSFVLRPDPDTLRRLYAGAMLFIKASRFDGLALAPLEAAACGTATCRAVLFGDDDLRDGETARRVDYNAERLFAACCELLEHPSELESLHQRAHEYAQTHLLWKDKIDRLESLYAGR